MRWSRKIAGAKAKLQQLADTLGYTLAKADGKEAPFPPQLTTVGETAFDGKLDISTG